MGVVSAVFVRRVLSKTVLSKTLEVCRTWCRTCTHNSEMEDSRITVKGRSERSELTCHRYTRSRHTRHRRGSDILSSYHSRARTLCNTLIHVGITSASDFIASERRFITGNTHRSVNTSTHNTSLLRVRAHPFGHSRRDPTRHTHHNVPRLKSMANTIFV